MVERMHEKSQPNSRMLVVFAVAFYVLVSQFMIMANKWVLGDTSTPLFFLWIQLLIATTLFKLCDHLDILPNRLGLDLQVCKALMPLVTVNIVSLILCNSTLTHVDASFYQIARGLILPFTVLTSSTILHSTPSFPIIFSCFIISLGFLIGILLDGTPISLAGIQFGVTSSFLTALQSTMIKKALNVVDGSTLVLGWYTNALSTIVLIPVVFLLGEGPEIATLSNLWNFASETSSGPEIYVYHWQTQPLGHPSPGFIHNTPYPTFLAGSVITGVLGFLMSISCLLSIKITSPITHMISSAIRGVLGSFLGVWLFDDIISIGRASSIAIILLGSILYTAIKHHGQERQNTGSSTSMTVTSSSRAVIISQSKMKIDEDDDELQFPLYGHGFTSGCSTSSSVADLDLDFDLETGIRKQRERL